MSSHYRQATAESSMYRQGTGYIVSTWDPAVRCNRVSEELPYHVARQTLAEWRRERAESLAGAAKK